MSGRLLRILLSSFPKMLLACVRVTIPLTLISFALGLMVAFLLALVQVLNVRGLKQFARIYIWLFRGTPLLVQLYIIFFGLPSIGITLDAWPAAIVAFSLNVAAYSAETIRAAIQSVPAGQTDAAYMVGLRYGQSLIHIILPQAMRVAFPPLFNSLISLTKDTSLAAVITVADLFKTSQQIAAVYFEPMAMYCEAAVIYLLLNTLLTLLQSYLEKKMVWKPERKRKRIRCDSP